MNLTKNSVFLCTRMLNHREHRGMQNGTTNEHEFLATEHTEFHGKPLFYPVSFVPLSRMDTKLFSHEWNTDGKKGESMDMGVLNHERHEPHEKMPRQGQWRTRLRLAAGPSVRTARPPSLPARPSRGAPPEAPPRGASGEGLLISDLTGGTPLRRAPPPADGRRGRVLRAEPPAPLGGAPRGTAEGRGRGRIAD
jgi:hypothetical protein